MLNDPIFFIKYRFLSINTLTQQISNTESNKFYNSVQEPTLVDTLQYIISSHLFNLQCDNY